MIRQSLDALARFSPTFRRVMMRTWYESLVVLDREKQITFMNYGYASLDGNGSIVELRDEDAANRYAIQLYHQVASALNLQGKAVVEIGSGRGGGAAYISRALKPKSMMGIDISKRAVDFCNQRYANERLSFAHGDAEHIPLDDNSVDVIINIESSHCYGSMAQFLNEVRRSLRPGGSFLFADHRDDDKLPLLRSQIHDAGLDIAGEADITANVVRALELDNDRRKKLIHDSCSAAVRGEVGEFAALVGSRTFHSFASGASRYFCFAARTPR